MVSCVIAVPLTVWWC